ncbi:MAG: DUF1214 domain-containing protein [Archaeoglobi archaeon]|nr:DUF1214 domain-containing protein [Archaeoglobi archaeon]TDA29963.1 MAG: hypothetical protein DSO00_02835 [Archaeoglobi archaeon]
MKLIWQILIGIALGIISAYLILCLSPSFLWIQNGPWKTSMVAGSHQADPYTRAIVAKNYLYILNKSEAIYFIADTDGERRLNRNCDYRVEGIDLPARWWSITVYGEDNYLIPNEYNKYSVTSANVVRHNGNWTVYISKNPKGENWIPLRGDGWFYITLRLYNPDKTVYENLNSLKLPKIILEGCR